MSKLRTAAVVAVATLVLTPTANAGLTWDAQVGLGTPEPGVPVIDFDGPLPAGVSLSFTGDGGLKTGSTDTYAAPFGDATQYASSGIGSATLTFPAPQRTVELDWSTVDQYNTFQLFNGATLVGTLTGSDIAANANGSRGPGGTYHVNVAADQDWNTMVASSTQYAFEFDNVATQAAASVARPVPEPASLAMLGSGLLALGMVRKKRNFGRVLASPLRA